MLICARHQHLVLPNLPLQGFSNLVLPDLARPSHETSASHAVHLVLPSLREVFLAMHSLKLQNQQIHDLWLLALSREPSPA